MLDGPLVVRRTQRTAGATSSTTSTSDTEPAEVVVVRSTQEAVVVNLDDHPHAPARAR